MSKTWILVRTYILNSFGFNKAVHSKNKKDKSRMVLFGIGIVFLGLLIMLGVASYNFMFAEAMAMVGKADMQLNFMMAITCAFVLFTTIFKVNGILFGFKDYDLLMSFPIKTSDIIKSRLIVMYMLELLFTLMMMIPAGVVYCLYNSVSYIFYPIFIVLLFVLPLIPIVLASIAGTLVSAAASRFKYKNLLNTIFLFAFMIIVFVISFSMGSAGEEFGSVAVQITSTVNRIYPFAAMFARAVNGDILQFVLYIVISIALFALFAFVFGFSFKKLNTSVITAKNTGKYVKKELKTNSVFTALLKKEFMRFFRLPLYIFNNALGMLFMVIINVMLIVSFDSKFAPLIYAPESAPAMPLIYSLIPFALSFCVIMITTSCCSISLEGKSLWILKTLPVNPIQIIMSKVLVNLILSLPLSVVTSAVVIFYFRPSFIYAAFIVLIPVLYSLMVSFGGMFVNLRLNDFAWTNEIAVIKQSPACMITALGSMVLVFLPVGAVIGLMFAGVDVMVSLAASAAVLAVLDAVIILNVVKTADIRFNRLG